MSDEVDLLKLGEEDEEIPSILGKLERAKAGLKKLGAVAEKKYGIKV